MMKAHFSADGVQLTVDLTLGMCVTQPHVDRDRHLTYEHFSIQIFHVTLGISCTFWERGNILKSV